MSWCIFLRTWCSRFTNVKDSECKQTQVGQQECCGGEEWVIQESGPRWLSFIFPQRNNVLPLCASPRTPSPFTTSVSMSNLSFFLTATSPEATMSLWTMLHEVMCRLYIGSFSGFNGPGTVLLFLKQKMHEKRKTVWSGSEIVPMLGQMNIQFLFAC